MANTPNTQRDEIHFQIIYIYLYIILIYVLHKKKGQVSIIDTERGEERRKIASTKVCKVILHTKKKEIFIGEGNYTHKGERQLKHCIECIFIVSKNTRPHCQYEINSLHI